MSKEDSAKPELLTVMIKREKDFDKKKRGLGVCGFRRRSKTSSKNK